MEQTFVITGGKPLQGHVELSGAKNIALKVLVASLLFKDKVVINHVPRIEDIKELIHLLQQLGAQAEFTDKNTIEVDPSGLHENNVDLLHASKIRVSFMLFAPLLYRFGVAHIPNPGGCRLGARSIDRVVEGLQALGISVVYDSETGYYKAEMKEKPQGTYSFKKSSHTGTELMIMMSVFCKGTITIENAAQEPEIDDLMNFLNESGADIRREGTSIIVNGVEELRQQNPYSIASDRVEAVTYAVAGIATKGDVTISSIKKEAIEPFINMLEESGAGIEQVSEDSWRFFYKEMKPMHVETAPHPGFLTDWQPLMAVLMTQVHGKSTIHERIFENRFSYVEELRKLGAEVEYIEKQVENPSEYYFFNYDSEKEYQQVIEISGPQHLHGGVLTVADLRAGATLAIAALIADGESYVRGIEHLQRGYEDFEEKIQRLGGEIKKI